MSVYLDVARRRWWVGVLFVILALAALYPAWRAPFQWGNPYDWRYFQSAEEAYRRIAADYHQAPLWNPYLCGGEVALANPQATWAAPTFLLTLLFGTPLGMKLALAVYLLLAMGGGYHLGRTLGRMPPAAALAGISYGLSGWLALHLSIGHFNFAGAALYPYLLVCFYRALDADWRWLLGGGALMAWIAGLGGTFTAPMAGVLVGGAALCEALTRRSLKPLGYAALLGGMALLLGAARLLPVLEFAHDHPRKTRENDAVALTEIVRAFVVWQPVRVPVPGHRYWWHEYGCHLPYLALALALWGGRDGAQRRDWLPLLGMCVWGVVRLLWPIADARWARSEIYLDLYFLGWSGALLWVTRRGRLGRLGLLVVLMLGLAVGQAWPHGPWWLLRQLPLYRDLRVPTRYLVLVLLGLCQWSALGLEDLAARLAPRLRKGLIVLAIGSAAGEGIAFMVTGFRNVFTVPAAPAQVRAAFHQEPANPLWMFPSILAGHGVLRCDEEAPLQRAASLDDGPGEQVRLLDPAAGTAAMTDWSPSRIAIHAVLSRPTDVLVNQNWNEHWSSSHGQVRAVAGRLAVRMEPGEHRLELVYRPRSAVLGAWVSALSWVMAFGVLFKGRRQTRTQP